MLNAEQIKNVVCTQFLGGDTTFPIDETMNLVEVGICDSLGLVQLASEFERQFGIRLGDHEINRNSLGAVTTLRAARCALVASCFASCRTLWLSSNISPIRLCRIYWCWMWFGGGSCRWASFTDYRHDRHWVAIGRNVVVSIRSWYLLSQSLH